MTASIFSPSVDAVARGFGAALRAYPDAPTAPTSEWANRCAKSAKLESGVLYLDDWHRGVALALDCLARCHALLQPRRETSPFVRSHEGSLRAIAARVGETGDGGVLDEDLYTDDLDALELLVVMFDNVQETGDPDTYQCPEAADEIENELGDDEQAAVLSRLQWETVSGTRVLISSPWEGESPEPRDT